MEQLFNSRLGYKPARRPVLAGALGALFSPAGVFAQIFFAAKGTDLTRKRSYTDSRRCDNLDVSRALMEDLLESFVTAGLGLDLVSVIEDISQLPEGKVRPAHHSQECTRTCAAWYTSQGRVVICATYEAGYSQRMKGHVLWLEWWIPPQIHHEGWWRVEPRWPRDWIKGHGSPTS